MFFKKSLYYWCFGPKLNVLYIGVVSGIFIYKYPTYYPYIQDIQFLTKTPLVQTILEKPI